jgi:hypothetical protein
MWQDEPFPMEAVSSRVRNAILDRFAGRWPSVREVAQISDKDWLTSPGVGPTSLQQIRSITRPPQQQYDPDHPRLTDAELLERLEILQEELRWIQRTVRAMISKTARNKESAWSQDQVDASSEDELSRQ